MCYLLSLPDDWTIYLSELEKHSDNDGRESISNGIKELIKFGYIVRDQERSVKGTFGSGSYSVHEYPQEVTLTANGFPVNGLADSGKPATSNTHVTKTHITNDDDEDKSIKRYMELATKYGATEEELFGLLGVLDSRPISNPIGWLTTALRNVVTGRNLSARPKTVKEPKPKKSKEIKIVNKYDGFYA